MPFNTEIFCILIPILFDDFNIPMIHNPKHCSQKSRVNKIEFKCFIQFNHFSIFSINNSFGTHFKKFYTKIPWLAVNFHFPKYIIIYFTYKIYFSTLIQRSLQQEQTSNWLSLLERFIPESEESVPVLRLLFMSWRNRISRLTEQL